MIREMRIPVWVESKYRIGRRVTWAINLLTHFGDGSLGGDPEHLRQPERCRRLNKGGTETEAGKQVQLIGPAIGNHVVDDVTCHPWQYQPREATGQHHHQSEREPLSVAPDKLARLLPRASGQTFLLGFRQKGASRDQGTSRSV